MRVLGLALVVVGLLMVIAAVRGRHRQLLEALQ